MNLGQLQSLCEIVDRGLRVSDAAKATYRSQPGVSRQIQRLEFELGFTIFERSKNRIVGLTAHGEQILAIARRMVRDAHMIHSIGEEAKHPAMGDFTIATTHTFARYVLPSTIARFVKTHPEVALKIRQGNPEQCCSLVAKGHADVAICSGPPELPGLSRLPCYELHRCVVVPFSHPLLKKRRISLEDLADYPLITYDEAFSGGRIVAAAFQSKGLRPRVVLSAVDADVAKVYVAMRLGIAIFVDAAFDPDTDTKLRKISASHLFQSSVLCVVLRRENLLRSYMVAFLRMFAPDADVDSLSGRSGSSRKSRVQLPRL